MQLQRYAFQLADLKLLGAGKLAEVYALDEARALKVFVGECGYSGILHEYQGGVLAYRSGVPAPRIHELCMVNDRYAMIMERIDGTDMLGAILAAEDRSEALRRMIGQFAAAHQALLLVHAPDAPDIKQKLKAQIESTPYARFAARLQRLPDGDVLCHGDFHRGNVMLRNGQPVVIDFMGYGKGAAELDIARTFYTMTYAMRGLIDDERHIRFGLEYLAAMRVRPEALSQSLPVIMAARLAENPSDAEREIIHATLRNLEAETGV